jgi:hypothetical protein
MARPPVNLDIQVVYVTPDMALEWLQKNTHNRRLSERLVGVYAEAIKNAEWRLNGEPIIFDKKNVLQSGQHRLMAIVEAMTPIWTVVVRGAEPDNVYSLDSGRKRRMADVLYLRGEKNVNVLASALSWLWRWKAGAMDRLGETATNTHLLKLLDETPEIRESIAWGDRWKSTLHFSSGLVAAIHWGLSQVDEEDTETFFNRVWEGTNLERHDPAFRLREWALNRRADAARPSQVVVAAIIIKAWNAFRDHREVKVLHFRGGETFPEAI